MAGAGGCQWLSIGKDGAFPLVFCQGRPLWSLHLPSKCFDHLATLRAKTRVVKIQARRDHGVGLLRVHFTTLHVNRLQHWALANFCDDIFERFLAELRKICTRLGNLTVHFRSNCWMKHVHIAQVSL